PALGLSKAIIFNTSVDAGHCKWFSRFEHDAIRLLATGRFFPFVEAIGDHEAVPCAKARAKHRLIVGSLEPRVVLRADARATPGFRYEAPTCEFDHTGSAHHG